MATPTETKDNRPRSSPLLRLGQIINNIRRSGGRGYLSTTPIDRSIIIDSLSHRTEPSIDQSRSQCQSTPRIRKQKTNKKQDRSITNVKQCERNESNKDLSRSKLQRTPRTRKQKMNKSQECDETVARELFKSWVNSQEVKDTNAADDDITLVKQRFKYNVTSQQVYEIDDDDITIL